MSETATRPPGLRMRKISRKTAGLSAARLMTQLEITQSAEPSASGVRSMVERWNSTFPSPCFAAFRVARSTISGVMSMPMAFPAGPTFFAARNTSRPPPEPRSTTTSPDLRCAVAVGFPHESPMFASAGMFWSSSAEYPNASATAWTPALSFVRPLAATAAYFSRTTWVIVSLIAHSPFLVVPSSSIRQRARSSSGATHPFLTR